MIPTTVPKRPMNGAVEPIVARPPSPRFISVSVRTVERSSARETSSTRAEASPTVPRVAISSVMPSLITRATCDFS